MEPILRAEMLRRDGSALYDRPMTTRLSITNARGRELSALLDLASPGSPHVLLLHGFTGWKEEPHIETLALMLASSGLSTLRFDAPGSGESEGSWESDFRVTSYLESVVDVFNYVQSSAPVSPRRFGIWGHSMGGLVAILAASRLPGQFQTLCVSQPSTGRMTLSEEERQSWETTGIRVLSNERFPEIQLPYDFYIDRIQYSSVQAITSVYIPTLFLAGSDDVTAPRTNVKAIFDAANEPKEYQELPGDHFYKNDPALLSKYNEAACSFFIRTLLTE